MDPRQPLISIDNVSVTYRNGFTAIKDITIDLLSGKICGLVGANGAGKSTLYKTLMGFMRPSTGKVKIEGKTVGRALKDNLIAYVPQSEDVDWNFPVLVRDVVMMGRYGHMGLMRIPSEKDKEAVKRALERVDITGFETRQIGELSGGQKKRVFLARALAQQSDIILLDEPFTGVDVKTEVAIIQLLRQLRDEGKLILVSTHNLGTVPDYCDEVMLINQTLIAAGPVASTFTQKNLEKAFGPMLRHIRMEGGDLHEDADPRTMTVITDDERPLVYYGETEDQKLVKRNKHTEKEKKK